MIISTNLYGLGSSPLHRRRAIQEPTQGPKERGGEGTLSNSGLGFRVGADIRCLVSYTQLNTVKACGETE